MNTYSLIKVILRFRKLQFKKRLNNTITQTSFQEILFSNWSSYELSKHFNIYYSIEIEEKYKNKISKQRSLSNAINYICT
jgi:hypothetical protein